MKRTLLLILAVFVSIGMYANTGITKASTPTFDVRVSAIVASTTIYQASVFLTNPGADQRDQIGNIDWDFGDGSAPVLNGGPVLKHFYQPGTYTITMTFTYITGETFVVTKQVVITPIEPEY
ncbi:PKD domain-containing protein [Chitinophaga filiformis]|uniref:PKD domain-containing protein n=1 Tax=Chitinophaga filiformis TaxID=104663 RepID=UPI001F1B5E23|nr:PKD domain-containing protein [Chitinophaga filiformis]MCF6404345.1 PKD domain-containing protein [Chitinophaga filiformis]